MSDTVDLKKTAPPVVASEEKVPEKGLTEDSFVNFDQEGWNKLADSRRITKYTSAGQALGDILKKFIPTITAGKKVLDLCIEYVLSFW
jgi:hypothetical protein